MARPEGSRRDGLFHDLARTWWDASGVMHALGTLLDPVRVPFLRSAVVDELGPGAHRVLDVGAGGGRLSARLADLGHSVTALDPTWSALAEGRKHAGSTNLGFVGGVGERLPFTDGTFDVVLCMETLEHVADPAAVIREAARVLRHGGLFAYSGPNRTWASGVVLVLGAQILLGVVPRGTHRWRRLLRPAEVASLMRSAGIRPVVLVGIGSALGRIPSALRALVGVLTGRLTHTDAARRIRLETTSSVRFAYQGYGVRQRRVSGSKS